MRFSKILTNWYSEYKRELPWRKTIDPYKIWLSEIILQQTQVKQGLPYYHKFLDFYPSIFDLANASEEQVLKNWQGLGYYSRARNLHSTAKYVAGELHGVFPDNYSDIIKLKGIGDYTASAIASICFNAPTAVVDGNVYRVLARYFGIDTPINSTGGQKEFKQLATELIDVADPAQHNQAIMEFGAIQCKPSNPDCVSCPLNNSCVALQKDLIRSLPIKLKNTKIKKRHFNYLIVLDNEDKVTLEKREGKGIWQNMFQFPLIETNKEIGLDQLMQNTELKNHLDPETSTITLYNRQVIIHKLSHQHLHTKFWIIEKNGTDLKKIDFSGVEKYPIPVLISNFVNDYNDQY